MTLPRKQIDCQVHLQDCLATKGQLNPDKSEPIESNNSSQSYSQSTPSPPLILQKNFLMNPGPSSSLPKSQTVKDADEVDAVDLEKATLKDVYKLLQKVVKENRQLRKKNVVYFIVKII